MLEDDNQPRLYMPGAISKTAQILGTDPEEIAGRIIQEQKLLDTLRASITQLTAPYEKLMLELSNTNDSATRLSRKVRNRHFDLLRAIFDKKRFKEMVVTDSYSYQWAEIADVGNLKAAKIDSQLQYDEVNLLTFLRGYRVNYLREGNENSHADLNIQFQDNRAGRVSTVESWLSIRNQSIEEILQAMHQRRTLNPLHRSFYSETMKRLRPYGASSDYEVQFNLLDPLPSLNRIVIKHFAWQVDLPSPIYLYNPKTNTFDKAIPEGELEKRHGVLKEDEVISAEEYLGSLEELLYLVPAMPEAA